MKIKKAHIRYTMVTVFTVTMFFSCKDNSKAIQNLSVKSSNPLGIMENANGKYTNIGIVKSNLKTPKMLDYSNREFPFFEFPDGIDLDLFDDEGEKSNVIADYAIVYQKTGIVDLRGNVVYTSAENSVLKTEQLFYDQNREWVFTNYRVNYTSKDGEQGTGSAFDSDKDFDTPYVLDFSGSGYVDADE